MDRREMDEWLVDGYGYDGRTLTDDEVTALMVAFDRIDSAYSDQAQVLAARVTAYRVLTSDSLNQMVGRLGSTIMAQRRAYRDLQAAAIALVPEHESEASFARRTGIDLMTVRRWLGKR